MELRRKRAFIIFYLFEEFTLQCQYRCEKNCCSKAYVTTVLIYIYYVPRTYAKTMQHASVCSEKEMPMD
jgi:hypothetical protein